MKRGIANPLTSTIALLILVASCSRQESVKPQSGQSAKKKIPALIMSAAASTTDAMEQLTKKFLDESGIEVKVNAGPSNGLATQIIEGAPADLFLSASREWADKVAASGKATEDVELLTNRLAVVVPKGNPAQIKRSEDLTSPKLKSLALAGEGVPAGRYADQALSKLELLQQLTDEKRIARGQDVRATLSYVEQGEAEAGIVYVTDAAISPSVEIAFEFDPTLHDEIVYVLVLLKHADENPSARKFYEFLQSDDAEQIFTKFGFMLLPVATTP